MDLMKNMPKLNLVVVLAALLLVVTIAACSSITLKPADFSWPVETVLSVDKDGIVKEDRHNIIFDTRELFLKETGDSTAYIDKEVRLIRDTKGYFYMTAKNFKNVYVFRTGEGELKQENKIEIGETGMQDPAFNQRLPYIELVDGNNKHLLTSDGIEEGK